MGVRVHCLRESICGGTPHAHSHTCPAPCENTYKGTHHIRAHAHSRSLTRLQKEGGAGGDVVHFASCDYIYLLGVNITGHPLHLPKESLKVRARVRGFVCSSRSGCVTQCPRPGCTAALPQTCIPPTHRHGFPPPPTHPFNATHFQVNQVDGMYVEDSTITAAAGNALDYVAVHYGHICRTYMGQGDWCTYVKGGSAHILIDSNTVADCGQSGLRVGQGTGGRACTRQAGPSQQCTHQACQLAAAGLAARDPAAAHMLSVYSLLPFHLDPMAPRL